MINIQISFRNCDLTKKYYFDIIDNNLKIYRLVHKLKEFRKFPEKELLERLLTIVTQYFYPHISYSIINSWLDDIKQKVLIHLKYKYPAHSIFSTSSEQFSAWRDNNIDDNFWDPTEAMQIIHILGEFLFSHFEIYKQLKELCLLLDLKQENIMNLVS